MVLHREFHPLAPILAHNELFCNCLGIAWELNGIYFTAFQFWEKAKQYRRTLIFFKNLLSDVFF
jgi:hypothetical protein